jgi:hypothetical protein
MYGIDGEEEVKRRSTDDYDCGGEDERRCNFDILATLGAQFDNSKALCRRKPGLDPRLGDQGGGLSRLAVRREGDDSSE